MTALKTSATCANCSAKLYEGQSAAYDELADLYYCDKACQADHYGDRLETYQYEYVVGVDL